MIENEGKWIAFEKMNNNARYSEKQKEKEKIMSEKQKRKLKEENG